MSAATKTITLTSDAIKEIKFLVGLSVVSINEFLAVASTPEQVEFQAKRLAKAVSVMNEFNAQVAA